MVVRQPLFSLEAYTRLLFLFGVLAVNLAVLALGLVAVFLILGAGLTGLAFGLVAAAGRSVFALVMVGGGALGGVAVALNVLDGFLALFGLRSLAFNAVVIAGGLGGLGANGESGHGGDKEYG